MCRTGEMIELIPLRVVFVSLLILCCCPQPCTGQASFNSPLFTIRGPCPNDTVLLVPVGDTVQYRCDYDDRRSAGIDLPYWHITDGEGSEHVITIIGISGSTTLSIPVKEQYLWIYIQCGLCEVLVCVGGDRLSENIMSTSVKLVSVGKLNYPLMANSFETSKAVANCSILLQTSLLFL